jgi:hypothetical protein
MAATRATTPKTTATPVSALAKATHIEELPGASARFPTPTPEGTGIELAHSTLASASDILHLIGVAAEAGADPSAVNRTLQRCSAQLQSARGRLEP